MTDNTPKPWARDERGRFGAGNPGGPGGSKKRSEFRRAIENAITPEHAAAVMRKVTVMAIGGNTKAAEIVLNRVDERPTEAPVAPEAHNLRLPDLASNEACREAAEAIVASMNKGDVDRKTAKTMLDGVNKAMLALRAAKEDRDAASNGGLPARPIPSAILRALVANFQLSGELPDDVHEAAAVVRTVKAGFVVVTAESTTSLASSPSYGEFVAKARENDPVMDALLDEAAFETGFVRALARYLLRGMAKYGHDVTAAQYQCFELPEFGSVSMQLTGFLERLAKPPYAAQARRLRDRMEADARRRPERADAYWRWRERADAAIMGFQYSGVRPDDPSLLETILNAGELTTLISYFFGEDVHDVMPLFNTAASTTGEPREAAIDALQTLARAGRFCG